MILRVAQSEQYTDGPTTVGWGLRKLVDVKAHVCGRAVAMELHQIRYFLAVARERNFTKAARACHVSQPSLTRAIGRLESELGGLVFERKLRGCELTELGRLVLPSLKMAHRAVTMAMDKARGFEEKAQYRSETKIDRDSGDRRRAEAGLIGS
jgi:Mn-dependent DtxR family transcriptional regulator